MALSQMENTKEKNDSPLTQWHLVLTKRKFNHGSKFDRLKNVPRRQDRRTLNARYRRKMDRCAGRKIYFVSVQNIVLPICSCLNIISRRKLICCILVSGSLLLSLGLISFLSISHLNQEYFGVKSNLKYFTVE